MIRWQGRRRLGPSLQMVLHGNAGSTWKWTAATLRPFSGTSLKDSSEGKSSLCVEYQAMHLVLQFAWKEKWPGMQLHTNSPAMDNGLADDQGLGGTLLESWWQGNLGGWRVDRLLWTGKNTGRYLCHMWMLSKGRPQQRRIWIIKWLGWPILSHQSAFLQPPLSLPNDNGLMNKVALVVGVEVMHGLRNMDFHSPKPTLLWPPLSAQTDSSRYQHWVVHPTPFARVVHQPAGSSLITLDHFHHRRGSVCSYWNRHSRCRFAFSAHNASAKTTICGLIECRIHRHVFHTALLLAKKLTP